MLPVFIALALPCLIAVISGLRQLTMPQRGIFLCVILFSASALAWPAWVAATATKPARRSRAFVMRTFIPQAHASRDAARKKQSVRSRAR